MPAHVIPSRSFNCLRLLNCWHAQSIVNIQLKHNVMLKSSVVELAAVAQAPTLGTEVAHAYAEAITLLRGLESSPVDAAALVGLDAAALHHLNEVFRQPTPYCDLDLAPCRH
jgi:hypothetical protein